MKWYNLSFLKYSPRGIEGNLASEMYHILKAGAEVSIVSTSKNFSFSFALNV
jgi:hypothetical protein